MVLETPDRKILTSSATPREQRAATRTSSQDPFAVLLGDENPSIDDIIEAVSAWADMRHGTAAIVAAQQRFFDRFGKFFTEDPFYEARMSYFIDWYVLFRRSSHSGETNRMDGTQSGQTLFSEFLSELGNRGCDGGRAAFIASLAGSRHSLFHVLGVKEHSLTVRDLLTRKKVQIEARNGEVFHGFSRHMIVQGCAYQLEGSLRLSPGHIVHPPRVARILRKYIKNRLKAGGEPVQADCAETLLGQLSVIQLRHRRHAHVEPRRIYKEGFDALGSPGVSAP